MTTQEIKRKVAAILSADVKGFYFKNPKQPFDAR
jgi:hypothetical protein